MRRTRLTRTLASLLAIWLSLTLGEPALVHHHCPMHDAPAAAHAGHAGHGEAPTHHGPACTCIGACSASSSVATLAAVVTILAPRVVDVGSAAISPTADAPATHRARVLPFANGPPVTPLA